MQGINTFNWVYQLIEGFGAFNSNFKIFLKLLLGVRMFLYILAIVV